MSSTGATREEVVAVEAPGLGEQPGAPSTRPLYAISVAAELTGVNAPMLRAYETKGLIGPHRTPGGTRVYSNLDLASVNRITTLLAAGLNLAGIQEVLRLEGETSRLRRQVARLRQDAAARSDTARKGDR